MAGPLLQQIEAIRGEYRRIDSKWLEFHLRATLGTALFAVLLEVLMFFILNKLGAISIPVERYLFKYLLVPFVGNLVIVLLAWLIVRSNRLTISVRAYMLSLLLAVGTFQVYTIHSIYPSLFLIFTIPMTLTVVYADQRLTALTATACILGKGVSDLFLFWDPDRTSVLHSEESTLNFLLSLLLLLLFYGICYTIIVVEREKNEASIRLEQDRLRMEALSLTDELTGVGNRQALRQAFQELESEAHLPCALAMLDMDNFKQLNDTFGHCQGDQHLQDLGRVLLETFSPPSPAKAFRYGGDEFCILFGHLPEETIRKACVQVQDAFAHVLVSQGRPAMGLSMGVAWFRVGESPVELIARADAALYRAKTEKGSICFET